MESTNLKEKVEWPTLIIAITKAHLDKIKCKDKESTSGVPRDIGMKANTRITTVMEKALTISVPKTTSKANGKTADS